MKPGPLEASPRLKASTWRLLPIGGIAAVLLSGAGAIMLWLPHDSPVPPPIGSVAEPEPVKQAPGIPELPGAAASSASMPEDASEAHPVPPGLSLAEPRPISASGPAADLPPIAPNLIAESAGSEDHRQPPPPHPSRLPHIEPQGRARPPRGAIGRHHGQARAKGSLRHARASFREQRSGRHAIARPKPVEITGSLPRAAPGPGPEPEPIKTPESLFRPEPAPGPERGGGGGS